MLNTILNICASVVAIIFLILVIINIISDGESNEKIDNSKTMNNKGFRNTIAAVLKFLTKRNEK